MYGKHFASAYTGSMYGSGIDVFAVWGWIIANADSKGRVEINPRLLADTLGKITPDEIKHVLDFLMSPDPNSRSKELDGCRIVREGEFQYLLVNAEYYKGIRDSEDRREYNRRKQAEGRAARQTMSANVSDVSRGQPRSAHTEEEEEVEEEEAQNNHNQSKPPRKRGPSKSVKWPIRWISDIWADHERERLAAFPAGSGRGLTQQRVKLLEALLVHAHLDLGGDDDRSDDRTVFEVRRYLSARIAEAKTDPKSRHYLTTFAPLRPAGWDHWRQREADPGADRKAPERKDIRVGHVFLEEGAERKFQNGEVEI